MVGYHLEDGGDEESVRDVCVRVLRGESEDVLVQWWVITCFSSTLCPLSSCFTVVNPKAEKPPHDRLRTKLYSTRPLLL